MGRQLRHHLPGATFHLTARIQGHEPLLLDRESAVIRILHETTYRSDARLLAYGIMANHLHVAVVQGRRPLCDYMQPALRRIALLVQRSARREGHVFERRFHSSACHTAEYFRNIISYIHLNPVRAGICAHPAEYSWTSHASYLGRRPRFADRLFEESVRMALLTFAHGDGDCPRGAVADYEAFLDWRLRVDDYVRGGGSESDEFCPMGPSCNRGTAHWFERFGRGDGTAQESMVRRAPDLAELALMILHTQAEGMDLDWVRSGGRTRALVRVRRAIIADALQLGYSPSRISRFLQITPTAVSHVATMLRCRPADVS